jgi:hypothetical protein
MLLLGGIILTAMTGVLTRRHSNAAAATTSAAQQTFLIDDTESGEASTWSVAPDL